MHYRLKEISRDEVAVKEITEEMSKLLTDNPKHVQAQVFIRELYTDNLWVSCSCADRAQLFPRKKGDWFELVRMPNRGDHADDCFYSELNKEIRRTKYTEELKGTSLSFHRAPLEPSGIESKPNITVKGVPSEYSFLGKMLLTVYQKAGLNHAPLTGKQRELSSQYKAMRETLANYEIAGKKGKDVVFTHPSSYQKAVETLYKDSWHEKQIPHVLLFFTVDSIADKQLRIKVGNDTMDFDVHSRVEYLFDDSSPPYNCLMTLGLRDSADEPEILRCAAVPIINKAWLLPVKNHIVRRFTYKMVEYGRKIDDPYKEMSRYNLLTPFFPQEIDGVKFRPDFYIDRDGSGYVAIYFQSKRNDLNYGPREDEMAFLRSLDVRVEVFNLDELFFDIDRAIEAFVSKIYRNHFSYIEDFHPNRAYA